MQFERNIVFWLAALVVFVGLLWLLSPILLLLPFVLGQLMRPWLAGWITRHSLLTKAVDRGSMRPACALMVA